MGQAWGKEAGLFLPSSLLLPLVPLAKAGFTGCSRAEASHLGTAAAACRGSGEWEGTGGNVPLSMEGKRGER